MNKSMFTNLLAFALLIIGHFFSDILFSVGMFALAGSLTNWLAIHMLFEKIPGLYGSGVIPSRFNDFKLAIQQLMMSQFFTVENIDRFLSSGAGPAASFDIEPVLEKVDLSPAFDSLVNTIEESSFGGMLSMVGGVEALTPLKQPFIDKMKSSLLEISKSDAFSSLLVKQIEQPNVMADMQAKISSIINKRLDELTPQIVKEIIQDMIKQHLGWLVVWGGVFGGLIGLVASFFQ